MIDEISTKTLRLKEDQKRRSPEKRLFRASKLGLQYAKKSHGKPRRLNFVGIGEKSFSIVQNILLREKL